jgi:hypothetical protein
LYFVQGGCLTVYTVTRKLSVSLCVFVRRFAIETLSTFNLETSHDSAPILAPGILLAVSRLLERFWILQILGSQPIFFCRSLLRVPIRHSIIEAY